MSLGTLRLPPRIHFGYGSRAQLPELLAQYGTRVLAVVDPFLLQAPPFLEVRTALEAAGIELTVLSDIQPELPVDSLTQSGEVARRLAPDVILAIGGGSALDAAKVIALLARHGAPLSRYYGENAVPGPVVPIVAVPTTAGTGSEVTPVAVVSDPGRELKVGISSPWLVPSAAVIDPEFTLAAPATVTAYSGIDALVHIVESFTARPLDIDWTSTLPVFVGRNTFTDAIALDGANRIGRWLPVAVAEPGNREAREQLAFGSTLGGMAFGPAGTHLSHALQYPLGALTHTPHGLGTGLLLPYVMDAIRADAPTAERLAQLATAFGSSAEGTESRVDDAVATVVAINRSIGVPSSLAEIGLTREQLPHVAELALRSARLITISPIDVDAAVLLEILERAFIGHPPLEG